MNPQMLQQAQQMMSNMSPEQMADMQRMVADMPPEQRAQMQQQAMAMGMGGAGATAPSSTPAQPRASAASASPELGSATALKNEGNALHKAGKFSEAVSKYEEAQHKLQSAQSIDVKELRHMCMLNKAMCLLKLEDWQPCREICTKVLDSGPNLKAYYRRGQALMGELQWHDAILDLKRALALCPEGDAQRDLIATKLAVAKAHQPCDESTDLSDTDSVRADAAPFQRNDGSVIIEDETDARQPSPLSSTANSNGAAMARGVPPNVSTQSAEQMARMMQENPAHVEQMVSAMDAMSDAEFAQHVRQQGLPNVDRAAMKQAMSMFKNMSPEQARTFTEMARGMQGAGGGGGTSGTTATRAPPTASASAGVVTGGGAAAPGNMDPAAIAQMMQGMTPEQMASMTETAKSSGMLPAGMDLSPEMLKTSMAMMKNMKPEDMARMQRMAASGSVGGADGAAGAAGGTPDMSAMLGNPEMLQTSMRMMADMSEDDLVGMLKSSRPGMSDDAARKMAQSMKAIDPDAKWVKGLMGVASVANRGWQSAKSAQQQLARNPLLLAAVVFVVVALLLKLFGVM